MIEPEADDALARLGLTDDQQKTVQRFVRVANACTTNPELAEVVNRVLARAGLELARVH